MNACSYLLPISNIAVTPAPTTRIIISFTIV